MRLLTFFLFAACLSASASGTAQSVTLSGKNLTIKEVFTAIKKQTGYIVGYAPELFPANKTVSLSVNKRPLHELLDVVLKDQSLEYEISDKTIFIFRKTDAPFRVVSSDQPASLLPPIDVHGKVLNENGEPVEGVTIMVKGTHEATATDTNGFFVLRNVDENAILVFSGVNVETYEIKLTAGKDLATVRLKTKVTANEAVTVTVSTGFQDIPKERATGSFVKIDNELLNRRVSTNVLDRLDGITSGLIFNKNTSTGNIANSLNYSDISIRGRSTLFANPNPLIVVDNFPYTGDISNINPNDVESITVLKDAAAASIWGAYSGNGVIVITTKKGKLNTPPTITLNSNVTFGSKPDLYYLPFLNSSDYIEFEKNLFDKGYYNGSTLNDLSPVVEILFKNQNGLLSDAEANTQIDALKNADTRKDLSQYFYRKSINQQYNLNVKGGSATNQYYLSGGYDRNLSNQVGNRYNRYTIAANNNYHLFNQRLELTSSINFSQSTSENNAVSTSPYLQPYIRLADDDGNALPVSVNYRSAYLDTIGQGKLLDWRYRPLDELNLNDNETTISDYKINLGINYKVVNGLKLGLLYQYNRGVTQTKNYYSPESYFARDEINLFSQIDYGSGTVNRIIPSGGVLDQADYNYTAHNGRGQVDYAKTWNNRHNINAIAGIDISKRTSLQTVNRLYGYDKELETFSTVDFKTLYPNLFFVGWRQIPNRSSRLGTTDFFLSYFANIAYNFKEKYTITASGRKDASNLFGVNSNQKGVPLYSVGAGWELSKEPFYHSAILPYLKLRVTDGYNGNIDKSTTAFTTADYSIPNSYGAMQASISNPPNPFLRWEKINILNVGLDFSLAKRVISGTIEFYKKGGTDLIADAPFAPSTGITLFRGNVADISGRGFDLTLISKNADRTFKWQTTLLMSHSTDKVTDYKVKQSRISAYFSPYSLNPVEGKPIYSIYSYKWAGLDPATGDPQGILDKAVSKDYSAIGSSTNFEDLVYNGPATPTLFGSLRNDFSYKQFSLSFNIIYKVGYYFRRESIQYNNLATGTSAGHPDYELRWQAPGDENNTNIPSFVYPLLPSRDDFYQHSEVLVEKGDHIRLQDVQASYLFNEKLTAPIGIHSLRVYFYANNLGILWRANNKGIDPDFITGMPNPKSIAIGTSIRF